MSQDMWNPAQYERFKKQRAQPFWDLVSLLRTGPGEVLHSAVDLGCGTGELTLELHRRLERAALRSSSNTDSSHVRTLGIDTSAAMLKEAEKYADEDLEFRPADIHDFVFNAPREQKFDLVFSNAALQWLSDHETLVPQVLNRVAPNGQVAIQMPFNFDHPSHRIAQDVAREFPEFSPEFSSERQTDPIRHPSVLPVERYAEILFRSGFAEQRCRIEVYMHSMKSGADVVEWTKGTLLTAHQKQLSPKKFEKFLAIYREKLLDTIGSGPYPYAFKRILLWGKRSR